MISNIVGISSVYAWFGKPHPVACGFQPWLLGLPTISMIAALSVKNFRIWRIFKFPMKKLRISDLELFVYWVIAMIPALVILVVWTIVSTPTAEMKERDGKEHFVCTTGGFTGEPGGYVFFGIYVAYSAFVLLIGAVISILARNVPSQFNETKLLTISIYNLGFLAVVIIPVFLAVNPFNPNVAWILRTIAILYAFTATMILQFVPMLWGVFITDKCKNVRNFNSKLSKQSLPSAPHS
uniref:G-protein coupled receptors family 3 profile domain-containing protein n=1 Tax=Vannella robusta TaxID=1487602 RepID=A0A7S4IU70_9EUKA